MSAPSWRWHAACAGTDPDLWFPEGGTDHTALDYTRRICGRCPVKAACLAETLAEEGDAARQNRYGTFAGTTPRQRHRMYVEARQQVAS